MRLTGHSGTSRTVALVLAIAMVAGSLGVITVTAVAMNPTSLLALGKLSPKVLAAAFHGEASVRVLVETIGHPSAQLVNAIGAMGGTVVSRFAYTPALAAYVPSNRLASLAQISSVKHVFLDDLVNVAAAPSMGGVSASTLFDVQAVDGDSQAVDLTPEQMAQFSPENFYNSGLSGVTPAVLTATGGGANTVLGIIDTGINSRHAAFTPKNPDGTSTRVIGGVDVSCDGAASTDPFCAPGAGRPPDFTPLPGFDAPTNHFHGSFVAAVAAGSGAVERSATGLLVRSIEFWTGVTLPAGPDPGMKLIPLIGIAPEANLFIIKIFDHTGLGVPTSIVLAGINAAISARVSDGVDIDTINMSLGGATLFDGHDLEDMTVDFATSQGILPVSAAGNDGPASNTVSSPGSAQTGIAVAAAADPVQVRIRRDQQLGVGNGNQAFVSNDAQVIFFSSRGPTSDGRAKPDLIAAGTFLLSAFAAGSSTGLAFGSGTSFSTPAVSGAAALLSSFAGANGLGATPFDVKQALLQSADPSKVPGYPRTATGKGFLNVEGALSNLQTQASRHRLGDKEQLPDDEEDEFGGFFSPIELEDGNFAANGLSLSPGRLTQFVLQIPERSDQLVQQISVSVHVTSLGNNPLAGNPTFKGNAVSVDLQSAKRTTNDEYVLKARVVGDATFTITDDATTVTGDVLDVLDVVSHVIEPGFFKVVVDTDWRSFDTVTFDLAISVKMVSPPTPDVFKKGKIAQDGIVQFAPITLHAGAVLELSWSHDWSVYPTSDVDMFIFDAATGNLISVAGATLNSPERVRLGSGATIVVILFGFEINPPGQTERWQLRIFGA